MSSAPLYAVTQPTTSRGLDANVWHQSLSDYVSNNPLYGYRFSDDFVETLVGLTGTTGVTIDRKWTVRDAAAAGGTYEFANVSGADGVAELTSTGTTNHFGAEAQSPVCIVTPKHSTTPRGRVVWQARVDWSTADTIFVGLGEFGQFLSATSQLTTTADYIGFYTEDNGATLTFVCANDNAGGTAVTDSFTIPASILQATGTYNNLAFAINTDGSVEIGVNGYWYGKVRNGIVETAIPIEDLCVTLAATAGAGTTAPEIFLDCVDCFVAAA